MGDAATVHMASPVMGAEDFSYWLQRVPGTLIGPSATTNGRAASGGCPPARSGGGMLVG